ncbi:MAG: hypothetical protein ACT4O0_16815 [Pseudonocardia sp.]
MTTAAAAFVQLFTRDPLARESTRALVLARLTSLLPSVGTTLQRDFRARPEQPADRQDFLWSGAGGALQAAVNPIFYPSDSHSVISLEVPLRLVDADELVRFVRELGEHLDADFGYATMLTEQDGVLPTMYLTQRDLRRWLPEVWHGLLLGGPYVDLIGAETIRSSPAQVVARNGPRGFWVQLGPLTPSRGEAEQRAEQHRRELVRDHLGADLFWRPDRRVYRTPAFGRPAGTRQPAGTQPPSGPPTNGALATHTATRPGIARPTDPGMP